MMMYNYYIGVVRVVFSDGVLGMNLIFVEGVAIMVSKSSGQAAANGIKAGDLIVELNGLHRHIQSYTIINKHTYLISI